MTSGNELVQKLHMEMVCEYVYVCAPACTLVRARARAHTHTKF